MYCMYRDDTLSIENRPDLRPTLKSNAHASHINVFEGVVTKYFSLLTVTANLVTQATRISFVEKQWSRSLTRT